MENIVATTEKLFKQAEQYTKTSLKIVELKLVANAADVFGILTSKIVMLVVVTLFCFILSIGLSYYIGQFLTQEYYGFFIMALLYLIILLLLYWNQSKWIKGLTKDLIISAFLKHQNDKLS